jgi:hypothetical protein
MLAALKTKMGTVHWWDVTGRGRLKYSQTEIDAHYIRILGFKVCFTLNTLILHHKDQPLYAVYSDKHCLLL